MKRILIFAVTLAGMILGHEASAQNVAINTTGAAGNASAALDIDFTNKGMLVPRVALTSTTSNAPIGAGIAVSLFVYNTATANDVVPGYYWWNGTSWQHFSTGMLNPGATTNFGKFYVNGITLNANTILTLTVTDPNCRTASQISVSWAGLLPGTNTQDSNIRFYNVQTGAGQWVIQIANLNSSTTYTGLSLAFTALY